MPRIRTIKPEFWLNEELSAAPPEAALLAIGILNHSDDEGYFKANPALLKASIFPLRELSVSIQDLITDLSSVGYIEVVKGADGKQYGRVKKFNLHQKINRPSPSQIKNLAKFNEPSLSPQEQVTGERKEGKGKEGKEGEGSMDGKFHPPSLEECQNYAKEKGFTIDPERFFNYYGSNGWKVGKNPMKSWKQAMANWNAKDKEKPGKVVEIMGR